MYMYIAYPGVRPVESRVQLLCAAVTKKLHPLFLHQTE